MYGGPKGIIRMWAYLALIDYGQTFLAWTFNTHRGGEEQALFGLLDHDGTPSWKYEEYKRIASEFSKLQHLGFPRYHKPDVAIAYSFESNMASHGRSATVRQYFTVGYGEQVESAFQPFFDDNIDVAMIHIGHGALESYKLVVVPADYLMDAASADAIRNYVRNGGTVIMTAMSAKVDETNQWFDTPMPGRLSDVFGIRTEEFYRPGTPPELSLNGKLEKASIGFYEVLEPRTAKALATFTNTPEKSPAITVNNYGKGRAIYVAVPAQMPVLAPLVLAGGRRRPVAGGAGDLRLHRPVAAVDREHPQQTAQSLRKQVAPLSANAGCGSRSRGRSEPRFAVAHAEEPVANGPKCARDAEVNPEGVPGFRAIEAVRQPGEVIVILET